MDVYIATETALNEASHRTIIEKACAANPNLRGAHVADILDMYDMHDGCVAFLESPYWESADGRYVRNDLLPNRDHLRVACIAVCLISGENEPTNLLAQFVSLLARRAYEIDQVTG